MKKFLFSASAIAVMIFAGSCQKGALKPVPGEETSVKFSIELPANEQTKALSQAENTDIVYYEIWNSDWSRQLYPVDNTALASAAVSGKTATIDLTLVSSQTYNFIFWAQNEACGAYDVNELKKVVVDYSVIANADERITFYIENKVSLDHAEEMEFVIVPLLEKQKG